MGTGDLNPLAPPDVDRPRWEPMMRWRYFRRTGGMGHALQVFRWPDNGKPFAAQDDADVQCMTKEGDWVAGRTGVLEREFLAGWFDEREDEISEDEALRLIDSWRRSNWPAPY